MQMHFNVFALFCKWINACFIIEVATKTGFTVYDS